MMARYNDSVTGATFFDEILWKLITDNFTEAE